MSDLPIRKDGGEAIIEDKMILGRDLASLKIEDKSNIGFMLSTKFPKDSKKILLTPLGELLLSWSFGYRT